MNRYLLAAALIVALMLGASASWGAIGVYKIAPANPNPVPTTDGISYMLNADATDTTDGWSVKIEIVPDGGGAAVRTYKFLYGDPVTGPYCLRGMHTKAVIWNGKTDANVFAPAGNYKAVITAKRLPVTGTAVVPLWETPEVAGTAWRGADIVNDPDSPYYGYIYAARAAGGQDVIRFEPDGSNPVVFYDGNADSTNWGYSGPFGVQVATDGKVYAHSFSKSIMHAWNLDGTGWAKGTAIAGSAWSNPRFFTLKGSSTNNKTAAVYELPHAPIGLCTASRILTTAGDPNNGAGWNQQAVTDLGGKLPYLMKPGIGPDDFLHIPAYYGTSTDPDDWHQGGRLMKWNFTTTGTPTVQAENWKIRRGASVAFTQDGAYAYVSRFVDASTSSNYYDVDQSAIYRIPADKLYTTADPDNNIDCVKLNFACTPAEKLALMIETDTLGNLVSTGGSTGFLANGRVIGVYEPPDPSGAPYSVHTRSTSLISWIPGEYSPTFDSSNGPLYGSSCDGGSSVTVTVQASDENGYLDIWRDGANPQAGCFLDRAPWGLSEIPMNPVSGNGATATYSVTVSIPVGTPVGDYELPIYVRDRHYPTVAQVVGSVKVNVAGAWISGEVTNSVTGWPVEGATVTATGALTFTAVTDENGAYIMGVDPGTYEVNAAKPGVNFPCYAASADPATTVVADCNTTAAGINRTLDPLMVWDATGGNARNDPDQRAVGEVVCVRGTVVRAAQDVAGGVANGLNGYYYIYDMRHLGVMAGCKIRLFPGQATLKEGDDVVVEGTWVRPGTGRAQGELVPIRAPYLVASGKALPSGTNILNMSYYTDTNNAFGRLMKYSSSVVQSDPANDRFLLQITRSPSDGTPWNLWVYADTETTTGITIPAAGALVEVLGFNAVTTDWGDNVLVAAKASDVYPIPIVSSLGAARALPNGGVILDITDPALAPIITYVDPGEASPTDTGLWFYMESPDRSSGLKVNVVKTTTGSFMPTPSAPGTKVMHLRGNLILPGNADRPNEPDVPRELVLTETPTTVAGSVDDIPRPLFTNARSFGGSKYPAVAQGQGPVTEGLIMLATGVASGYGSDGIWEWFYLDDGSGVPNEGGYTGIKVIRSIRHRGEFDAYPFPQMDGTFVTVQGIASSKYVTGPGRIRILRVRWDMADFAMQDPVIIF